MEEQTTTSDDLMRFLQRMNDKMELTIKTSEKNINDKLELRLNSLDEGINEIRKDVKINDKKVEDINSALMARIEKIEENMRRSSYRKMSSDTLGKPKESEENISANDQSEAPGLVRNDSWANEVEAEYNKKIHDKKEHEARRLEDDRRERDKNQWMESRRTPDDWTAGLKATVRHPAKHVDKLVEKPAIHVKRVEKLSEMDRKTKTAVRHWFCEDSDSSDDDTANEEDTNEDWNLVDRQKKNDIKKKRLTAKRNKKKEEILEKVNHMAGIGPIDRDTMEYHIDKNQGDFERAKIAVIREHLSRYYKYNNAELEAVTIVETKYNKKMGSEGTLYFATKDKQDIVDLFIRKSECKRDDVSLRNFVPPQIYKRFSALNKLCKLKREEYSNLKTQIRFGKSDLEILTKIRGSEDPFKIVNLKDFIGDKDIPEYEHDVKWKPHRDRAPRRRVSSSRSSSPVSKPAPPATRSALDELPSRVIRQLSINSDDGNNHKKRKGAESMDSCHSKDLETAITSNEDNNMEHEADVTL